MISITILRKKWYNVLKKPKTYIKQAINLSLNYLNILKYNPIISIVLADDILLHQLNYKYRKKDKPTNVLSFTYEALSYNCCLGEIFISLDTIIKESIELEIPAIDHTAHMLIHGLLHILGYDHKTSEETSKMQSLEIILLGKLGIKNPYI
ncbi:rRNA maturation RNase YbeY [Neoehrlichia mikurensis]|uniref:Endoribonuclease YbeY n=1 Tax=Neoehrlichia mikurensis TaxID=89586 RepID=A0A9Q9BU55_9RICK|nr:rRNA maturation RNase YbeY [Neoehrlichia mikurensis]QXK91588.1 rRNA maturation RNase YbeY [Neoehrlichia mikurensis]QXK92799.1 rRNA maturation RNase YbeY [Neoehrlichia mikurensis]QXK93278.1 rRNA maturation RNase YbeY [Neoehrlichia mikurensis]UTO55792.1 rRNA maturation RNase YbeY [Neoehrlichia mikurensis]UTO56707.1 rRNA maturation RNase YbeY [Neoehrlichia mikurensis]